MKTFHFRPVFAALLAALAFIHGTAAPSWADLWWDTNGATPGSGAIGGFWTGSNWSTSAAGDAVTAPWVDGETAVFSAGTDATGVSLGISEGPLAMVGGIIFEEGSYQIGGVKLSGNPTPITVEADADAAISYIISGSGGLLKQGPGTLKLQSIDNTYGGGTFLNDGVVEIYSDGSFGVSGAPLTIDGATVRMVGSPSVLARPITLNAGGGTFEYSGATIAGTISGSGSLTFRGLYDGTTYDYPWGFILSGTNTYSGGTFLDHARLDVYADENLGDPNGGLTFDAGILNLSNSGGGFDLAPTRPITLNAGGGTIKASGFNPVTISQTISGPGSLAASGLILNGSNTYSGGTIVAGYYLEVSADENLGDSSGPLTLFGQLRWGASFNLSPSRAISVIDFNGNELGGDFNTNGFDTTISQSISGNGYLWKSGAGTLTLAGNNTYSGETRISGGVLEVSDVTNLGNASAPLVFSPFSSSATLRLAGSVNLPSEKAVILDNNPEAIFDTNGFDMTISGPISGGTGSLVKTGAGTLTLAGNNTYYYLTQIDGGTLRASGGNAIPDDSTVLLANTAGAIFDLNGTNETIGSLAGGGALGGNVTLGAGTLTIGLGSIYAGAISGTGSIIIQSPSYSTQQFSGNNTYSGGTSLVGGTLSIADESHIAGATSAITFSGGILQITGTSITNLNGHSVNWSSFNGGFDIAEASHTFIVSQNISGAGSLTKAGAGTLTVSGNNSYSGGTHFNGGILHVASNANLGATTGSLAFSGGTLRIGGSFNTSRATALGTGGDTIDTNGFALGMSGIISGTGGLTKTGAGTLTLSGTNSYSGGTQFNGGILHVTSNANLGATSGDLTFSGGTLRIGGSFNISSGRSITLSGSGGTIDTNGFTLGPSGNISGTGGLTKSGAGTLTLSGNNTYSGGTTLAGGTLSISSNSHIGGATTPITFSGGTLRVTGTTLTNLDSHPVNWGTFNGGFEIVDFGNFFNINQNISGPGSFTKSGVGWVSLNGNNTYTGGTVLQNGFVGISGSYNIGGVGSSITFAGGILLVYGTGMTNLNNHNVNWSTFNGGFHVGDANNVFTISQNVSGTGSMIKTGDGTLVFTGNNTYTGSTYLRYGPTVVNAGTLGTAAPGSPDSNIEIAPALGDVASMTVNGGTVNADRVIVAGDGANTAGGTAVLTQTGGTINSEMWFSVGAIGNGTFNMSGGTLNVNARGGTQMEVSTFGNNQSAVNLSGSGQIRIFNNGNLAIGVVNNVGQGTFNQNGGSVTFYSDNGVTVGGTGIVSLGQSNGTFRYNLNAGTLAVGGINHSGGVSSTGIMNFNGGTLRATRDNATYITNLDAANVQAGGAILDTNNFAVTVPQALLHDAALGATPDGGLTKTGAGTLTLSGNNTYTGPTNINAGTLRTSGGNAIHNGSQINLANVSGALLDLNNTSETIGNLSGGGATGGNVNLGTGALTINQTGNATYAGAISGTGGITKIGAGRLTLTGTNTYTGQTNINAGMLTAATSSSVGAIPGGQVTVAAGASLNLGGGLAGNNALNFGQKIFHIAGDGGGLGALTNRDYVADPTGSTGAVRQFNVLQRVVLDADAAVGGPALGPDSSDTTYPGRFDLSAAQSGGVNVAELNLNGHNLSKFGPSNFCLVNVDVIGAGNIQVSDAGSTLLLQGGTVVHPNGGGKIVHGDGTMLQFWNLTSAGATRITRPVEMGDGTLTSNSFVSLGGGTSSVGSPVLLKGDLTVRPTYGSFANTNLTLTGNINEDGTPRKLIKSNVATLILSGSNSFTGGLAINPGTSAVPGSPGTGIVQLGSAGALHPANIVSFAPAAAFTGVLQLNSNSTSVAGLQATSSVGTAIVENAHAAPATLTVNSPANNVFNGVLQNGTGGGALSLTKSGAGTLTLGGANTYSGLTDVQSGTLLINGTHTGGSGYTVAAGATLGGNGTIGSSVVVSGTIAPGASAGTLTVGALTLNTGSTFQIELGGAALSSQYDHLTVTGQATLGGPLNVSLINAFAPHAGQSFDILDWGTRTGTFATLTLPALTPGLMWNASQLYDAGVVSVRLAGDYNQDDSIDAADYVVWRKTLGQTGTGLSADGNSNGQIDPGDHAVWKAHFGDTAGSGAATSSNLPVPEPASWALMYLAAIGKIAYGDARFTRSAWRRRSCRSGTLPRLPGDKHRR